MSVAMTNCGRLGWVSDRSGYRYDPLDPDSGQPWPAMPPLLRQLALDAAQAAGFPGFAPDACLINRYAPGTRLSLHQDRDEGNYAHPIVSVSLGIPAVFLWGGAQRSDKARRIALMHGDVVVWGGPARLRFHGVLPLPEAHHPMTGSYRINLTFRKAG
jgi:alkylated DNA repair protein (DNA oxidative demethylase)